MKRNLSWIIIQWPYPLQAWVQSHWFCVHEPSCSFQPVLATAYDTWVAEETKKNENTWTPSHVIMACWHKGIRTTESTNVRFLPCCPKIRRMQRGRVSACRTRNPAVQGSNQNYYLDLFLVSPEFKFLATLENSQLICLPPVGILNKVMFNLNYLFQLFARPH